MVKGLLRGNNFFIMIGAHSIVWYSCYSCKKVIPLFIFCF